MSRKSGIATRNPAFNRIITEIEQAAVSPKAPMLLTGPADAGKSFLARQVFALKKARRRVAVGRVSDSVTRRSGGQTARWRVATRPTTSDKALGGIVRSGALIG